MPQALTGILALCERSVNTTMRGPLNTNVTDIEGGRCLVVAVGF